MSQLALKTNIIKIYQKMKIMIGKEVEEIGYANIEEVYKILKKRKPSDLKYEQQIALDHAEKFKIDKKSYTKIKSILDGMEEINDSIKAKILEILPKNEMLLKQILASERASIDDENKTKLLKSINESV